jgi:MoaA/NifB/PqqE/SkfB family radical SAM enzyme
MDANRHPGSFKYAIRACNVLKTAGIRFRIGCVITSNNATIENVHFLLKLAKSYGTRCSFLVVQTVLETSGFIDSLHAQHQAVEACLDEIISAHKNGGAILFSRHAYELARKWPDFSKPRILKGRAPLNGYPRCWAGRFFCNVDTDGIVYPCCLTIGEVAGISAYEVGVRQALDQAARHNCAYCMSPGWIDYNQIFSLNPHALWHAFRHGHI